MYYNAKGEWVHKVLIHNILKNGTLEWTPDTRSIQLSQYHFTKYCVELVSPKIELCEIIFQSSFGDWLLNRFINHT